MPEWMISANLFFCEAVLFEKSSNSAIRICDHFVIENLPLEVVVFIFFSVKALVECPEECRYELRFTDTLGETSTLANDVGGLPGRVTGIPGGFDVTVRLNLQVIRYGTSYVSAFVDDVEVVRTCLSYVQEGSKSDE